MNQIKKSKFNLFASKNVISSIAVAGLLSSCSSFTTNSESVDLVVKKYELDNGLKVLISPNPRLPVVSYYTLYDVGGRDEYSGTTGATHFLEHMLFKGSKKYGPGEFDGILSRNGGSTNAFTSNDMTVYYEKFPSSLLEKVIDMEADRMESVILEKESFESERQVVLEERKMRYENSPDGMLYLQMMKKLFVGTPYAQSVIGEVEDLQALTPDKMMEFFNKFYVPNNAIIAIAGDVDPDKTIKLIKKYYGQLKKSEELKGLKESVNDVSVFDAKPEMNKEYHFNANNENLKFMLAFKGDSLKNSRMYAIDILSSIIGNGTSSYMNQKYVRTEKPILNYGYLANQNFMNAGFITFGGELAPGVKISDVKKQLISDFSDMCENAVNEKTLQKAKNQILADSYSELMSNSGVALMLVRNEKYFNDYKYSLDNTKRYNKVTVEEVKKECKNILKADESILVTVWNKNPKSGSVK